MVDLECLPCSSVENETLVPKHLNSCKVGPMHGSWWGAYASTSLLGNSSSVSIKNLQDLNALQ